VTESEILSAVYKQVGGGFGFGLLFATAGFHILKTKGKGAITFALLFSVVGFVVAGLLMFVVGGVMGLIMGFLFLLLAAINFCYYNCVKNRIPFANANLMCSTTVAGQHTSLFFVALAVVPPQLIWLVVSGLAMFRYVFEFEINKPDNCVYVEVQTSRGIQQQSTTPGCSMGVADDLALFCLTICLYWGMQVWSYVCHVVTAGANASWWFSENPINVVSGAVKRAMTTSFGSISFAALIIAYESTLI
jgi:hypothetical protein